MSQGNTVCWVDIPVVNLDRAIQFYQSVLDAPVQKIAEHGLEFGLLPHTQDNVSGCLVVMADRQPSKNGSLIYFNVEGRLPQAVNAAQENGGTIVSPIEQIGPYGNRAVIMDTEGNAIALYAKEV